MAIDWPAIEAEFISTTASYKELGNKYGLKEGTVRQRANRHGWQEKRNEVTASVTNAIRDKMLSERMELLEDFNARDIEAAIEIRRRSMELLVSAADASEVRALSAAMANAQKIGRLAMGAETEHNLNSNREMQPLDSDDWALG
jgi:transcription elongation GreA/GreB family factor